MYNELSGCIHIGIKAINLTDVLYSSCNMGMSNLLEMYACSLRAAPLDFGHTFQANHSCTLGPHISGKSIVPMFQL